MSIDVTVWVATVRTADGRNVTAWSARDKAQGYVADQVPVEVDWKQEDGRYRATVTGELIGTIEPAPIQDPVSLAQQYPAEMPSTRFIKPDE